MTVNDNKNAPLKANNNFNFFLLFGAKNMAKIYPKITDNKGKI
jgi:hypothetical protein